MTEAPALSIASRLEQIQARITAAAKAASRPAAGVHLVAVSKTHDAEACLEALAAGQRLFGENRVQEAQGKWPALRHRYPGLELHLIGPLQTNKVADAVALFDVIETLDREKLARALVAERDKGRRLPRLYIQVNTGAEEQKAGILPEAAPAFIALCRDELALPVEGLMCIPPVDEEPAPHFALLAQLARQHGLPAISMGMSGDFEIAIRFGATHVRVGTAIFGERPRAA
ncbi:YggS family pyridoxal phosphate enzyme [Hypericibacter adhaerens]|uniref:Pyridoxal phosphate homeostasis protein n=1 Tax=Hypericibacter adhaerens TaxID=2602016 RepID=A0A5J6N853_9PROT|nr:YggS family pyridoxal phosphate-dependent enzyme [Hypericibacter adhaerens]QEX25133.1 YggS family pyridoxal phosphate enzyme [Hypericibacter adhaerens]